MSRNKFENKQKRFLVWKKTPVLKYFSMFKNYTIILVQMKERVECKGYLHEMDLTNHGDDDDIGDACVKIQSQPCLLNIERKFSIYQYLEKCIIFIL